MWGKWFWPPYVFLLVSLLAPQAIAQADHVAEELFRQGRTLLAEGEVDAACAKFEESQRLDPATGTLLNLAVCHERQGKLATAWGEYQKALIRSRTENRKERVDFASKRLATLEPLLPRVVLRAPAGWTEGLEVTLDGTALGRAALDVPFPVDPGSHAVQLRAPGYEDHRTDFEHSAAGEPLEIVLPPLTPRAPEPTLDAPRSAETAPPPEDLGAASNPPADNAHRGSRAAMFTAAGVGGLGIVLGTSLGIAALAKNGASQCDSVSCPTPEDELLSRQADDLALAADVAFITAGVALAVATTLWLIERGRPPTKVGLRPTGRGLIYGVRF